MIKIGEGYGAPYMVSDRLSDKWYVVVKKFMDADRGE